jgi:hypothetical protein
VNAPNRLVSVLVILVGILVVLTILAVVGIRFHV